MSNKNYKVLECSNMFDIQSVMRLSDGVIFNIGDMITSPFTRHFGAHDYFTFDEHSYTIIKIETVLHGTEVDNTDIRLHINGGTVSMVDAQIYNKPVINEIFIDDIKNTYLLRKNFENCLYRIMVTKKGEGSVLRLFNITHGAYYRKSIEFNVPPSAQIRVTIKDFFKLLPPMVKMEDFKPLQAHDIYNNCINI